MLVIANEDYTGVNPEEPPRNDGPKYLDEHVAALEANGVTPDVVGRRRAGRAARPRRAQPLRRGALVPRRQPADAGPGGRAHGLLRRRRCPDLAVAERQQYLTIAVRDFLNEGGKLALRRRDDGVLRPRRRPCSAASTTASTARPRRTASSTERPVLRLPAARRRLHPVLAGRVLAHAARRATGVIGTAAPLDGFEALVRRPGDGRQPDRRGRRVHRRRATCCRSTSSRSSTSWASPTTPTPCRPSPSRASGRRRPRTSTTATCGSAGRSTSPGSTAADAPTFEAQISLDTEAGYDHVIVEARPVGTDDWTTLPDLNGGTSTDGAGRVRGRLLRRASTRSSSTTSRCGDPCLPDGHDGRVELVHRVVGRLDRRSSFDLSAYAGQQVEVVVSYVTDPSTGGRRR